MKHSLAAVKARLAALPVSVSVQLPTGERVGPEVADVQLILRSPQAYMALVEGHIGSVAAAVVEGDADLVGSMRNVMVAAVGLLHGNPVQSALPWWLHAAVRLRSRQRHTLHSDAQQIRFHYDRSDDFYALWLDPRRVYSCAYYRDPAMDVAQAQEAKLDHICRKLALRPGEQLLDIGCGWGALLLWAAEHYGVRATGITLSHNQHAYVQAQIASRGLQDRVQVRLCDYRALQGEQFDKIASVGMFEHVGQAQLPVYFQTVYRLLQPGGMALIHGITAGGTRNVQVGAGMGEFIGRYIFPGGELMHISWVLGALADSGLEMVDTENLRPHYARTLWAWSDALEAQLPQAQEVLVRDTGTSAQAEQVLKAYRLYLAGCAMGFEQGWMALHQMLAIRPGPDLPHAPLPGAQSAYPFRRDYMYDNERSLHHGLYLPIAGDRGPDHAGEHGQAPAAAAGKNAG